MINFWYSFESLECSKEQRSELITKSNYEVIIQTDLIPYITISFKSFKDKKIQNRIMEKQMHVEKVGTKLKFVALRYENKIKSPFSWISLPKAKLSRNDLWQSL